MSVKPSTPSPRACEALFHSTVFMDIRGGSLKWMYADKLQIRLVFACLILLMSCSFRLTLEQKELCRSRLKLLCYLDRLATYEVTLSKLVLLC